MTTLSASPSAWESTAVIILLNFIFALSFEFR
jgi:hypothetical protein